MGIWFRAKKEDFRAAITLACNFVYNKKEEVSRIWLEISVRT